MRTMQTEPRITALYERLSRDDELTSESSSIVNQKTYLESYATSHGFLNCAHYTDDGWSGGNFDRPDWKRLVADIEAGKVGTVLVKDMSRIGRDYLQTGFYTEVLFRKHGVRFIAVGNGIDSNNPSTSEFAPFMNIMNEWYLRDLSRKQRASIRARGEAGQPTTTRAIYGYRKDPNDKHHWLIDEEAAEVVRRIYRMTLEGHGPSEIARTLYEEKLESPSVYMARRGCGTLKNRTDFANPHLWYEAAVREILAKPEYMGHTVNFRSHTESYKNRARVHHAPEDWLIFENTHEAIIDRETWELAQKLRKTPRRIDHFGYANPLTGLLFCADCSAKMYNCRAHANPETGSRAYDQYDCSRHKLGGIHRDRKCFTHNISTKAVNALLLDVIRTTCRYALENEADFAEQVRQAAVLRHADEAKALRKQQARDKKRHDELDMIIKKLYESYATGKLPEKRYETLSAEYEAEQAALADSIAAAQTKLDQFSADSVNIDKFLALARNQADFTELSPVTLNEFVDRVLVHAAVKDRYGRRQQIDVYLKYIGNFHVPQSEPTKEEIAALEREARRRETNRAYYARKKERMRQEKAEAEKVKTEPDTVKAK